jgi:hypothetical protein
MGRKPIHVINVTDERLWKRIAHVAVEQDRSIKEVAYDALAVYLSSLSHGSDVGIPGGRAAGAPAGPVIPKRGRRFQKRGSDAAQQAPIDPAVVLPKRWRQFQKRGSDVREVVSPDPQQRSGSETPAPEGASDPGGSDGLRSDPASADPRTTGAGEPELNGGVAPERPPEVTDPPERSVQIPAGTYEADEFRTLLAPLKADPEDLLDF